MCDLESTCSWHSTILAHTDDDAFVAAFVAVFAVTAASPWGSAYEFMYTSFCYVFLLACAFALYLTHVIVWLPSHT